MYKRQLFKKSVIPVVLIRYTTLAVSFGKPMGIHRDNIVLWVNSAFIWVFCAFVLIGYDDIMQSDYNITFILKEQL